jgi:hypothetical protein
VWAGWVGLARKASAGRSRRKTLMTEQPKWAEQLERSAGLVHTKAGDVLCLRFRPQLAEVLREDDLLFRVTALHVTNTRITVAHNDELLSFYRSGQAVARRHHNALWIEPTTAETDVIALHQEKMRQVRWSLGMLSKSATDDEAAEVAALAGAVQAGHRVTDLLDRWCNFAAALGVDPNHDIVVETKKVLKP